METDDFEWDDDKAADVARRQGVNFWSAVQVFEDPNVMHFQDRDHPETRTKSVVDDRLITVIWADGGQGRIRIITAWPSTQREMNDYRT
jgi:uncharacterized DUF497 family protein